MFIEFKEAMKVMKIRRYLLSTTIIFFICLMLNISFAKGVDAHSRVEQAQAHCKTLKGLVETGSKNVYIITKYWSRSRVDYKVLGQLKDRVAAFKGKVITVEGKIKRTGWSGSIEVKKIILTSKENNSCTYHITIAGIADLQGNLDNSSKGGGIARIAAIIKQIKAKNRNTLVLFSGDDLMGRYFHTFFGKAIYSLFNNTGLDVYALGNHEFDNGCKVLVKALKYAKFDVLCSDLSVEHTALKNICKPYVIKNIGGVRVGIFSLMTTKLKDISFAKKVKVKYDNVFAAKRMVKILKSRKVNLIIALTHIGYKQDRYMASKVKGIDIIFGGHSHNYLKKAAFVDKTVIVNGGERGKYVVELDVCLNNKKRFLVNKTKYRLIRVSKEVKPIAGIEKELEKYKKMLPKSIILGKLKGKADLRDSVLRFKESAFADTVNDILKKKFKVDVVLDNSGMFRGDKIYNNNYITDIELHNIFEFDNTVVTMKLKGRYIKKILEKSALSYGGGGWLQVAGIKYVVDLKKCSAAKIERIKVGNKPLKDNKIYSVLTNDFLARGGNGYFWFKKYGINANNTYTTFYSVIASSIANNNKTLVIEKKDKRIETIKSP